MKEPPVLTKRVQLISDGDILPERPELAVKIAQIAASATELDVRLGLLLSELIGDESGAALAMFLNLKSARRHALHAAAEFKLEADVLRCFNKIMNRVSKISSKRDQVVHGHWAYTNSYPDALINTHADQSMKYYAAILNLDLRNDGLQTLPSEVIPERRIYRVEHFDDILQRLHEVKTEIVNFRFALYLRRKGPLSFSQSPTPNHE